ncbi:gasdermin-E-like isoform X2 [Coregonus clupeaformis]|uniref:gasdermin-E-like isoform X2 n=1 Tax=Coregonus clupeaformis TaxID=59861 RepID=UPI001BE0C096|nr:gasdermin-E-like isoform X2 [Coregonus clupeaformis]
MFSKATKAFVKDTDHDGRLIPVSSLNDTDKLNLRSLIVKTRPRCFWHEPKYQSPGFTLSDVLKPREPGDSLLSPTVKECDFVDYTGKFGDKKEMNADGNVQAKVAGFKHTVGGKWSTNQKLSLGSLNKEKVDMKELYNYSKDRVLDMSHPVIKQTRVNPRAVLGVLTERIMTSLPCPVTTKVQKRGNVGACVALSGKASMKQSGSTQTDSDVSLVIPANTVMAYSLIDLYVKCNGQFELCLIHKNGGFEMDKSNYEFEEDGIMDLGGDFDVNSPLNLKKELEKLSGHFQLLSALPAATRSSLLQLLKTTMEDGEAVSVLESVVQHVAAGGGETLSLRDAGLAVLTEEEVFGRTESLFGHSKVTLKREEVTLRTEMKDQPGYLPLVMSITVKGLAFLVQAERE